MDWREFIAYVKAWALANEQKIGKMWPQKGGWEEWAKPEILHYIVQQKSSADILREQHPWGDQREADFVLNKAGKPGERIVVEFKAQSFENYKNFLPGVLKDVTKSLQAMTAEYAKASLLVVGLYFTEHKNEIPSYFTAEPLGNGEIGICYAVDQR